MGFLQVNLDDRASLRLALQGMLPDLVIHTAGQAGGGQRT